ncbi:MAG: adenylate/guanylate cyclase domain-containing protein [Magnetococcales bacterium]|nr:adenylate/guanylate cyclase domain-containing protein [Magnetococcales bacterium]
MSSRTVSNLSIMFADISGSTRLYETLGDVRARDLTSRCVELMSRTVITFQGRVIKTIGDEVMSVFPSADAAANAAVSMQESVRDQSPSWGLPLHIRVGFHFGEVIEEGGDVFGDAVNLAARMAGQAKADQIITTGETLERMNAGLRANGRVLISAQVKGKEKPIDIVELTWGEEEELTVMGGVRHNAQAPAAAFVLKVRFQEQVSELGADRESGVTLGRGNQNTFMVPDAMSSRMHNKIEFRRDRFVLVDQSTNGTYVTFKNGVKKFVHRDELVLEADGVLGLGRQVDPSDPLAIHFSI